MVDVIDVRSDLMVISNSVSLKHAYEETIKENDDYLSLYSEVNVPHTEMERIVSILYTRGRTNIEVLIEQLARNEYEKYLQRRYVYALMQSGEIEFDILEPITEETMVWTSGINLF